MMDYIQKVKLTTEEALEEGEGAISPSYSTWFTASIKKQLSLNGESMNW
jgi:hypothetical protein